MASSTPIYVVSNRTRTEWRGKTPVVNVDLKDMNSWNCCGICNHPARHPVCCQQGDVFCKECILEYLLENSKKKPKNHQSAKTDDNSSKKQKIQCPVCSKQIGMKHLLTLIFPVHSHNAAVPEPLCSTCNTPLVGDTKAYRMPCGHVICEDCYNRIVKVDSICPKCNLQIDNLHDVVLLNKINIDQVGSNGKIAVKGKVVYMPFG